MKTITIGRTGTQKTPISDCTVSHEHCRVTDNGDGTFTVDNLSQSGTKIDGRDIIRATARLDSRIQLGPYFSATLKELIGDTQKANTSQTTTKTQESQPPRQNEVKTFSISHLRRVWEDFNQTNIEMADKQRKINLTRTGFGIFSMCAMLLIFFFGPVGYVLTGIGVLGNIYSFVGMRNAETAEERQHRQDAFDEEWICPNPECGRTLLAKNYRMLVRNHQFCPYCKCKYVEK
ncbi:MAG: FHA domain-containing protein [Bacteroidales bacterium]|nr:FHA domain-containing protein [Bacteroidales bacterium]